MSTAVYLFSNDLRLSDNAGLHLAGRFSHLLCVYCVKPHWFKAGRYDIAPMSYGRWQLLQESLSGVQQALHQLGQQLHVCYGEWASELASVLIQSKADTLIVARQFGYWERKQLQQLVQQLGVNMLVVDNYTLFSPVHQPWLLAKLPKQYTPFRHKVSDTPFDSPVPKPQALPPAPKGVRILSAVPNWLPLPAPLKTPFDGGETAANEHLDHYFSGQAASHYKQTRNALQGWQSSSKFSVWLSQGNVSPRQIMQRISDYESAHGSNESTKWLFVELLWREYFQWLAISNGHKLFSFQGSAKIAPQTSYYPELFKRWCAGNTPYPLVNACMKELNATGYLSNRGRQIVASALVNELSVDWRYGAAWFEHHLLDYDVASNWGNWQYIAGVGCDPRGGRHFNIDKQTQQYDPNGEYQARWQGHSDLPLYSQDPTGWPITPND